MSQKRSIKGGKIRETFQVSARLSKIFVDFPKTFLLDFLHRFKLIQTILYMLYIFTDIYIYIYMYVYI